MKHIKNLVAVIFFVAVCLFSGSFVTAQNRNDSQSAKEQLSQIKGRRRIFVDVANENTKRKIEKFFGRTNQFEVVQTQKEAEITYAANNQVESRPSFGTVANQIALPILPAREREGNVERRNGDQFNKYDYEYRRKTSALAYYDEPNGNRVVLWSEETLRITQSKEKGATLEYLIKSGDELLLAKLLVKAIKDLK